jgi:type I restriction enzyme, R subunit
VRKAYTKTVYVDRAFQKKTNELVQENIDTNQIEAVSQFVEINPDTIDLIKKQQGGDNTKVINLVKSIEKMAEEQSNDPFLIGMAERAKTVLEGYEDRHKSTKEALEELFAEIEREQQRKREQTDRGFDDFTFFVLKTIEDAGVKDPEAVSRKIKTLFMQHPNWRTSEKDLREVRNDLTIALYAAIDDVDKVTEIVNNLLDALLRSMQQ